MNGKTLMNLDIYLYYWIISDGNYEGFGVGETWEFALEFYAPLSLRKIDTATKVLRALPDYAYSISGEVVYAANGVWVLDCGVLAYSEVKGDVQEGCSVGDYVSGVLTFDVDPFHYFERLYKLAGMPALIYEWRINSMEQDITPLILGQACGRPAYVRDETRIRFRRVDSTDENYAEPVDRCPAYVLHCTKNETPPRRKRINTLESLNDH